MATSTRRLLRETTKVMEALYEDPSMSVFAQPKSLDNLLLWEAVVEGPPRSPYEGGWVLVELRFTEQYPRVPPKAFLPGTYHPNVYRSGEVCVDILGAQWSPINQIPKVLLSIQSLLDDPNVSSPANTNASVLFQRATEEAEKMRQRGATAEEVDTYRAHGSDYAIEVRKGLRLAATLPAWYQEAKRAAASIERPTA